MFYTYFYLPSFILICSISDIDIYPADIVMTENDFILIKLKPNCCTNKKLNVLSAPLFLKKMNNVYKMNKKCTFFIKIESKIFNENEVGFLIVKVKSYVKQIKINFIKEKQKLVETKLIKPTSTKIRLGDKIPLKLMIFSNLNKAIIYIVELNKKELLKVEIKVGKNTVETEFILDETYANHIDHTINLRIFASPTQEIITNTLLKPLLVINEAPSLVLSPEKVKINAGNYVWLKITLTFKYFEGNTRYTVFVENLVSSCFEFYVKGSKVRKYFMFLESEKEIDAKLLVRKNCNRKKLVIDFIIQDNNGLTKSRSRLPIQVEDSHKKHEIELLFLDSKMNSITSLLFKKPYFIIAKLLTTIETAEEIQFSIETKHDYLNLENTDFYLNKTITEQIVSFTLKKRKKMKDYEVVYIKNQSKGVETFKKKFLKIGESEEDIIFINVISPKICKTNSFCFVSIYCENCDDYESVVIEPVSVSKDLLIAPSSIEMELDDSYINYSFHVFSLKKGESVLNLFVSGELEEKIVIEEEIRIFFYDSFDFVDFEHLYQYVKVSIEKESENTYSIRLSEKPKENILFTMEFNEKCLKLSEKKFIFLKENKQNKNFEVLEVKKDSLVYFNTKILANPFGNIIQLYIDEPAPLKLKINTQITSSTTTNNTQTESDNKKESQTSSTVLIQNLRTKKFLFLVLILILLILLIKVKFTNN